MNTVILIGRLGRDPELRYTQAGTAVTSFSLAVDRPKRQGEDKPQADWLDIVTWGKLAENCHKHLTKGRQVAVEGRMQSRSYEAKDGSKRKAVEVIAHEVKFLGGKRPEESELGTEVDEEAPF